MKKMRLSLEQELKLFGECKKCAENKKNCSVKDKIVRQYFHSVQNVVRKVLFRKTGRCLKEDIEDLRNEIFARLFDKGCRRLKQYDADKGLSPGSWILLISNRILLNILEKKDPHSISGYKNLIPIKEELFSDKKQEWLETREDLGLIESALEKLLSSQRMVIKLRYFDEMSLPEIAVLMNRSANAVYNLKFRAISQLRKLMQETEDSQD